MCNLHGFLERESNFLIKKPKIADKRPLSASQPAFGCLLPLDQLRLPHQKKNRISISKTPTSVLPLPWSLSMIECKWRLNESPFKARFTVAKFAEGQGEKKKKSKLHKQDPKNSLSELKGLEQKHWCIYYYYLFMGTSFTTLNKICASVNILLVKCWWLCDTCYLFNYAKYSMLLFVIVSQFL